MDGKTNYADYDASLTAVLGEVASAVIQQWTGSTTQIEATTLSAVDSAA
ncbi:MAG: hypothetical protein KGL35_14765 [Bradyrhizobium sp.]|nr:hypothetical protein [Bradyrhizobium sp.]